jgi:hypothetical protein
MSNQHQQLQARRVIMFTNEFRESVSVFCCKNLVGKTSSFKENPSLVSVLIHCVNVLLNSCIRKECLYIA